MRDNSRPHGTPHWPIRSLVKLMLLRVPVLCLVVAAASVPCASAQYNFHFGRNKIQYTDFEWHVLETEHFDVYHYPEMRELAEHGAAFAEEAYKEMQNRFLFSLQERTPLVFYATDLHFKQTNITSGFIPDGVGGFYEFLKGRVVIPANGDLHRFRRVVRHEIVHVFTLNKLLRVYRDHRIVSARLLPLWFTEGLAEYWSGPQDHQHEMVMRDAVYSNYLVPLENIYRVYGSFLMYKQGEALCRYIAETFGEEKLLDLIDNAWRNADFRKVMEHTLQEDYKKLSADWQHVVREDYYPRLSKAQPPSVSAQGIAVRGFSAKPAFYKTKAGRRYVYYVGNKEGYTNLYSQELDSLYRPAGKAGMLVRGERDDRFEAFHVLASRLDVSSKGRLAFVTKSGEKDVIHTFDLEANALESTYGFDTLTAVYSPTWDPEGERLSFSGINAAGVIDLYIFDTLTDELTRLTTDTYDDRDPAWRPDGQMIAFSSNRTFFGEDGSHNLFTYDVLSGSIDYVTQGPHNDFSPSWSPDGRWLVYTSARKDSMDRYGGQDIYVADMLETPPIATRNFVRQSPGTRYAVEERRLTNWTTAVFDPIWTADDKLVFTTFENRRFTVRSVSSADSLVMQPRQTEVVEPVSGGHWTYPSISAQSERRPYPYKKQYGLDIAQGQISSSAFWGTSGGAVLSMSDLLGNDRLYLLMYRAADFGERTGNFFRSLNIHVSRVQLHRRTNIGYGVYRHGGLRYDITEPDVSTEFPRFWETIVGGFGALSYPLSMFRRIEFSTSLAWDRKRIPERRIDRVAYLFSNAASIVHDNALFGANGPVDGWRGELGVAYTTDIGNANVDYITGSIDFRHYLRIARHVTFASRALGRINHGKEARLWFMGGSWDLRGYPLFDVRGKKMWFTSHEFRFPILTQPALHVPILAALGIVNLRGALFLDAAHAWNDYYRQELPQIFAGETLGSGGLGFRLNVLGGFVLRYDIGFRFRDRFSRRDPSMFRQFFFGFDF